MGSNNNKNQQPATQAPNGAMQQPTGYGPNANPSGGDPRGTGQNQSQYQQQRYEQQQGPLANQAGYNFGYGSTRNQGDYADVMNQYKSFANGLNGSPPQQGPRMPTSSPGGGGDMPQIQGVTRDPAQIDQWLQWQANQPGADPILKTQEGRDYYAGNIIKTDGLHSGNMDYWKNKSTLAQYGGAVGAGGGSSGNGGGGSSYGYGMSPLSQAAFGSAMRGYQGFADTGGYSPSDIANLRARGTAPIRAAYDTANQNIQRQRSLQGGYAPNAIAAQAKMAREQGQSMADAMQNVEGGIVNQRNTNMLAGNEGLSKTGLAGAGLGLNYDQLKQSGLLDAMQGQTSLYGATPGMANTFGNQAISLSNQGGDFGNNLYSNDINNQRNPGQFDTTMNRIGQVANAGSGVGNALIDYFRKNPVGTNRLTPEQAAQMSGT